MRLRRLLEPYRINRLALLLAPYRVGALKPRPADRAKAPAQR